MVLHALVVVLSLQGFAGKRGVVLTFEAFQPSGIREVGLVFLPAKGKASGDPLARDVCRISGKFPAVCVRAHMVRVKRFPLPPACDADVLRTGGICSRGAGGVGSGGGCAVYAGGAFSTLGSRSSRRILSTVGRDSPV